jgi:2-amino-4-hydroxy-6-hydroxymethyldihydropteridine diphosphokinase
MHTRPLAQPENTRSSVIAYVALGANLGHAVQTVQWAAQQVGGLPQTQLLSQSALYRSAPVDSSGPDYINAVIELSTALPAYTLLKMIQNLEQKAGRERPFRNAPRTLDLDLLLYGHAQIQSEILTVPHPRMQERAFVLLPLHEIAPKLVSEADLQRVAHQAIERLA